jgi:hypothetical protein
MYHTRRFFFMHKNWLSRFYLYVRWHQDDQKFYLIHENGIDKLIGVFSEARRVKRLMARIQIAILAHQELTDYGV